MARVSLRTGHEKTEQNKNFKTALYIHTYKSGQQNMKELFRGPSQQANSTHTVLATEIITGCFNNINLSTLL
jgi:hypothetical protein